MKRYNVANYLRYKKDLEDSYQEHRPWEEMSRDQLIIHFMPMVENIARKFATSEQASGILNIQDLIQEGNLGLVQAVDRIEWEKLEGKDIEKTLKAFLSKRIRGSIRRAIDILRGNIKIPEHKLLQIRRDAGKDKRLTALFFNSMFLSIDDQTDEDGNIYQLPDLSEEYNIPMLNIYLQSIMKKYLTYKEYEVLRMSYGLDCDKHSANLIAEKLNIDGVSAYVRVSELKKQAVQKLIDNVDPAEIENFI